MHQYIEFILYAPVDRQPVQFGFAQCCLNFTDNSQQYYCLPIAVKIFENF